MRRSLDLLIAVPAAIVTAPLVLVFCLLIRLESRGSPIFTQERAGLGGRPFQIFKLRTMVTGAEHIGAGLAVLHGDSRITRTGEFLRRYSLDELPNLWNVVRGEMAIVGPRPTLMGQIELYTERQRERLLVPPGHHRLGAGERPRVAAVVRADRARRLVRRASLAVARPEDPRDDRADGLRRAWPLPRGRVRWRRPRLLGSGQLGSPPCRPASC